jgi:hypothetical protein
MSDNIQGTATFSRTPQGRYLNDPMFHRVVDMLHELVRECRLTPSEIRDAAMLACIHYEANSTRLMFGQKPGEER